MSTSPTRTCLLSHLKNDKTKPTASTHCINPLLTKATEKDLVAISLEVRANCKTWFDAKVQSENFEKSNNAGKEALFPEDLLPKIVGCLSCVIHSAHSVAQFTSHPVKMFAV